MKSDRLAKVSRLIQKDLSDYFLQYGREQHALISVSEVRVTPDLSIATVYLSIYPSDRIDDIIYSVRTDTNKIRYVLGEKERFQLRIIPQLRFNIDTTLDKLEHLDSLLQTSK